MISVFKKLLLIMIILFPVIAKADGLSYTIKAKVDVDGINLDGGEFTFDLIDSDNNVIQNATNDKDGNIIFENIPYQLSDVKYNGGYIIRPDCNTEIQVFHNKYNEDKKEEPMIVSVPNTKAISILLITVGLLIIIISFIIVKKMI